MHRRLEPEQIGECSTREIRDLLCGDLHQQIAPFRTLDTGKRLREVGFFIALLAAGWSLIWWGLHGAGWWALLPGYLLAGLMFNACVLFVHEGTHHLMAKTADRNRWASFLASCPLLLSATAYRVTHQNHHQNMGEAQDIEVYWLENPMLLWMAHFLRLIFASLAYVILIPFVAWKMAGKRDRRWILQEYAIIAVVVMLALWFVPIDLILQYWGGPIIVMNVLTNIRGFASHGLSDPKDFFLASRTLDVHPFLSFVLLAENFHLDHHLFPDVPSYHLGKVHRLTWNRYPRALSGNSYAGFLWAFLRAAARNQHGPVNIVYPSNNAS